MTTKTTEELIVDFVDRFDAFDIAIEVEKRQIDGIHTMLWFIITAMITKEGHYESYIPVQGESYTLDNAIGEIIRVATTYQKPNMWPRRIKVELPGYETLDNVFVYKEKSV
jgi:hypothetical protein